MLQLDFRKNIFDVGPDPATDNAISFAEELERLHYGGMWLPHFVVRELPGFDTLTDLAGVAARTKQIMLGTAILQAPLYNPIDLARKVLTLDHLSGGRFVLGVGTGMLEREYELLGVPFKQRAGRLDEILEILDKLWTASEPVTYEGRYYKMTDVMLLPKPVQRPRPKIVVGGIWQGGVLNRPELGSQQEWSERAITRTARYADGWITMSTIPLNRAADILNEAVQRIKEKAKEFGRTITDENFMVVAETGFFNLNDNRAKALEEGEKFYAAHVARGYYQSRGNPSLGTHLDTGAYGDAQEIADFLRGWFEVKKKVPAMKRLQLNMSSLDLMKPFHRFHDEVFPLIEKDLSET